MALQPDIAELLIQNKDCITKLSSIHPSLYEILISKSFIVSSAINEVERLIQFWKKEDKNPCYFSLIIIPTLNCNLQCWYCYEKHEKRTNMKPDILARIKRLLNQKICNKDLKEIHLDFFGGEPLLGFNKITLDILQFANTLCNIENKNLTIHFTTNATLLNNTMIDLLENLNRPISFQITLDGNKEMHDAVRHTKTGKSTFHIIINNIKLLLQKHFPVNVRLNYTSNNIYSFADLDNEFKDLSMDEKKLLEFTFQQVWQDHEIHELSKEEEKMITWFREKNYRTNLPSQYISRRCYADFDNNVIINYNGDIFKCTARDFDPKIAEGKLSENGELCYNEKFYRRMSLKFGSSYCQNCSIYPICHNGCSQHIIESNNIDNHCPYNYSDKKKEEIIRGRLKLILTNINY